MVLQTSYFVKYGKIEVDLEDGGLTTILRMILTTYVRWENTSAISIICTPLQNLLMYKNMDNRKLK